MSTDAPLAPAGLILPSYQRPAGVHPPLDTPAYRSSLLRAPKRPPVPLAQGLTEVTGPLLGAERVTAADADLTRRHGGEPLGERIILTGRVLDSGGLAGAGHPGRDLAGQLVRPVCARRR